MKKEFSTKWKASKQPRKQRKYRANAPLHLKRKTLRVNLSKDLRKKHEQKNILIRKGDVVKIMRGKFKKKQGKVVRVHTKLSKIVIENIQVKKMDGSKADVKIQPSNLQIVELNLEDSKRSQKLKIGQEKKKTKIKEIKPKNLVKKETPKKTDSKAIGRKK